MNVVSPVKISSLLLLTVISLAAVMVAGCTGTSSGSAPTPTPAASGDLIQLIVNGSVNNQLQLNLSDLDTYPTVPVNLSDMRTNRNGDQYGGPGTVVTNGNGGTMPVRMNGGQPSGNGSHQASTGGPNVVIGPDGSISGSATNGMMPGDMNATGISLNALLDSASPADGATNVTFIGMGGRVTVVPLSEIRASDGAAVVMMGPGIFVAIVPGTSEHYTLLGLLVITVS
jgi:hypothetical protein